MNFRKEALRGKPAPEKQAPETLLPETQGADIAGCPPPWLSRGRRKAPDRTFHPWGTRPQKKPSAFGL